MDSKKASVAQEPQNLGQGATLDIPFGKWKAPSGKEYRITDRVSRFLEAYVGPAKWNATKAAEMAGYAHAHTQGSVIANKFRELIDWWVVKHRELLVLSPEECFELLAGIARNSKHKDQLRAIELAMKAHGLLSDRLLISTDRKVLEQQVQELALRIASQTPLLIAESSTPAIEATLAAAEECVSSVDAGGSEFDQQPVLVVPT